MDINLYNTNIVTLLKKPFNTGGQYPILTNLKLHVAASYNGQDVNTVVTKDGGNFISAMLPLDGTTITPSQVFLPDRPFFDDVTGINGLPAVEFGKGGETTLLNFLMTYGDEFTLFLLAPPSAAIQSYIISGSAGAETPAIISQFTVGTTKAFEFFNGVERETFSEIAEGPHLMTISRKRNVSLKMWYDGFKIIDQVAGSELLTVNLNEIGAINDHQAKFVGLLGETSVHDAQLSDGDADTINSYYVNKWL